MTQNVTFERVYEDHQVERIQTHLDERRGRSVEVHVEHHGPYTEDGSRRLCTNYTLGLFVRIVQNIEGDPVLEVRVRNLNENGQGLKPATTLVQLTPDTRLFR